jgi:hypothetical protein
MEIRAAVDTRRAYLRPEPEFTMVTIHKALTGVGC